MMTTTSRQIDDAMNRLEELVIAGRQIVNDVRRLDPKLSRVHKMHAYARVYWLRRELSRIVATLGQDVPPRTLYNWVADHYEKIIKD